MYGFVNYALEQLVLRNFGPEIWYQIKKEAGVELDGNFIIRVIYNDEDTYALVSAASKILNLPASAILELFGQFFYEFCVESGYDKILSVLGSNTKDFLQNLDALHDHLSSIYPGMRAPSFKCTEDEDGRLILHYYSDRPGLEYIVIGLVKTVALKLHNSEVECKIIKHKEKGECDHVQFEIIKKSIENEDLNKEEAIKIHDKCFVNEQLLSPYHFCRIYPFHLMFDKEMRVVQAGVAIARAIPSLKQNCLLNDVFSIIRPHINFDFQSINSQIRSVFVLGTKPGVVVTAQRQFTKVLQTRFKGQMVYLADTQLMLFQCSPSLMSLEDLLIRGFCLNDIPIHDATRDLLIMNEKWENEWNLTQNLEILTDNLQKALVELESEKKKTDTLLYSVLPTSIAQELRHGKQVEPARYDQVTLMFCGIKDFGDFCEAHDDNSQEIVDLLNKVFTKIDELVQRYPEIYKVETVGDKYMAVCGLPEKMKSHTKSMCMLALDIMDAFEVFYYKNEEKIALTIGINCGEIVTGVIGKRMPRYCLYGDTVNLTSRCETTGIKGKINLSEYAYENLMKPENYDDSFHLETIGEVAMKGKPKPIRVWLLTRSQSTEIVKL